MGKIIGNVGAFHRWRCGTKTAPRWWSAGGARQSMDEQQCEFRMGAATERERETARVSRQGRGAWPWQPFIGLGEGVGSRRWRERERKSAINDGGRVNRETTEHGRGSDRGGLRVPRSREESRRRLGSRRRRRGGVEAGAGAGADGVRKLQNNCWSLRMLLTGGPTCKSHRMEWREADSAHAP